MSKEINNLNKPLKDQLDLDKKQDKTDDSLATNDKTIVGAINELFQSANDGKQLIANAIGEPLNAEDTFSAMSDDINELLNTFRTNMENKGVTIEDGDRFKQLIDKIAIMKEEGNGVQYKIGTFLLDEVITFKEVYGNKWYDIDYQSMKIPKDFDMDFIYVYTDYDFLYHDSKQGKNYEVYVMDCILYDPITQTLDDGTPYVFAHTSYNVYDAETGDTYDWGGWTTNVKLIEDADYVTLPLIGSYYKQIHHALSNDDITFNSYYAVGLGEEDTTLRDSLASILQDKGIDVTEEDDMASLISKVNLLTMPNNV